jgi:hypothetical protein
MVWQSCASVGEYVEIQEETEEVHVDGTLWDALQRMTNRRRRPELWLCSVKTVKIRKSRAGGGTEGIVWGCQIR